MEIDEKAAQIRAAVINDLQQGNACGVCAMLNITCKCKVCAYNSTCKHTAASRIKCYCAEYIVKQILDRQQKKAQAIEKLSEIYTGDYKLAEALQTAITALKDQ